MDRAIAIKNMTESLKKVGKQNQSTIWKGGSYTTAKQVGNYKIEFINEYKHEPPIEIESQQLIVWSPKEPCMSIAIDRRDNDATLNTVMYSANCTIDGKMVHGSGTKEMIKFVLRLLQFKGVRSITLTDNSKFNCREIKVDLSVHYFIKYGMTWYEKNFGFKIAPKFEKEYEDAKQSRATNPSLSFLQSQPCDYYTPVQVAKIKEDYGINFFSKVYWVKRLQ